MSGAILRYRILAYATGIGLAVLCCIGLPLRYVWGHPIVVMVVGPLHGFLYIAYLLSVLELTIRLRWNIFWVVLVGAAGTVPFMSFVAEHYVTPRARRAMVPAAPAASYSERGR